MKNTSSRVKMYLGSSSGRLTDLPVRSESRHPCRSSAARAARGYPGTPGVPAVVSRLYPRTFRSEYQTMNQRYNDEACGIVETFLQCLGERNDIDQLMSLISADIVVST